MSIGKFTLKKSETILLSLFALASFYLFQTYYMKPKKEVLNGMKSEVSALQIKNDQNQVLLSTLQNRVPASLELKTSNELLDKYMKSNDRFSNVISTVISNSNNLSFVVNKIATESQAQLMGYAQTLYSIQASASFISIGKFLESLEDSPLLTEVQSIDIERTGNELKMCKANIKLFSYVSGSIDPGLLQGDQSAVRQPASGDLKATQEAIAGATVPASAEKTVGAIAESQKNAIETEKK
jgi:hypothetical protein